MRQAGYKHHAFPPATLACGRLNPPPPPLASTLQLGLWNWEVSRTLLKGKMFTASTDEHPLPKLLTFVPGLALETKTELEFRDRVEQARAHSWALHACMHACTSSFTSATPRVLRLTFPSIEWLQFVKLALLMGRTPSIPEPYCSSEWVQQWDNPVLEQPPNGDELLYPKFYDGAMVSECRGREHGLFKRASWPHRFSEAHAPLACPTPRRLCACRCCPSPLRIQQPPAR